MRGFTLIETLLVTAGISLMAMIAIPVYQSFQVKNDLDVAENTLVQSVRRAQILAQSNDGDSPWGVYVQTGSITVFRGASYAARNTSFDEIFTLPGTITVTGLQEIVMAKLTGDPSATGTTTLTSSTNQTQAVTINAKGVSSY